MSNDLRGGTSAYLLTADVYLRAFQLEGDRLAAVAKVTPLDIAVPTCPGWSLADLVGHCATVYSHKIALLRLGKLPEPGQWRAANDVPPGGITGWYDEVRAELAALLTELGPDAPCWNWLVEMPDAPSTVLFWFRRMAHEALIHRVDGEYAATGVGLAVPGSWAPWAYSALAADGVHEVLTFAGGPQVSADPAFGSGRSGSVRVEAGGHIWRVEMPDDAHRVIPVAAVGDSAVAESEAGAAPADAQLAGDPFAVDLNLWGRSFPDVIVEESGDPAVLDRLRTRLALVV